MARRRREVTEVREDVVERVPPPWYEEYWWLGALILLLFVAGLIAFFAFRDELFDDDRDTVPRVVGLREAQAIERLESDGFDVRVVRDEADEPRGQVVGQAPGAGTQVAEGETVQIIVSSGEDPTQTTTVTETETETEPAATAPEPVAMPDVVGQPLRDAVVAVVDAGLLPNTYPVEAADERGTVVDQSPEPGAEVEKGGTARLNVALGEGERAARDVPDLTGPAAGDALRTCAAAGFTCRVVFRSAPTAEEQGEVLDQRPAAGASAPELTQITLFVGR